MSGLEITFSGNPLDRGQYRRMDQGWLAQARRARSASLTLFLDGKPFVLHMRNPDNPREHREAGFLAPAILEDLGRAEAPLVFLGEDGDTPYFAVELAQGEHPARLQALADLGEFLDLRMMAALLDGRDAAILAEAKAVLGWHARHGFCAVCGAPSQMVDGGWRRVCGTCKAEHFPRTDPVVIMLAYRGDNVLLGRQAMFPRGMYSALAGFVEPGETLEEAVAREIMEEAGITVAQVRYVASQPWPFPASLMIGCIAEATTDKIVVDEKELDDARWFTRGEIIRALDPTPGSPLWVPPATAIAHQLLRHWVESA